MTNANNNDTDITEFDRRLLSLVEQQFPLVQLPFEQLADKLDCTAAEVRDRLTYLRDQARLVRQISAIFEPRALGYDITLVAVAAQTDQTDQIAQVINSHPGVSHNYLRWPTDISSLSEDRDLKHVQDITSRAPAASAYNLWFTLAVPHSDASGIEGVLQQLSQLDGVDSIRTHKVLKLLKLRVQFFSDQDQSADSPADYRRIDPKLVQQLQDPDHPIHRAVCVLQENLPLTDRPFDQLAQRAALTTQQLFQQAEILQQAGIMRAYRTIVNHRSAGMKVNVMLALDVSNCSEEQIIKTVLASKQISHGYLRQTYPDWPFGLFTMVHWSGDLPGCISYIKKLAADLNSSSGLACWSVKEYCKRSLKYFSAESDKWQATH